MCVCVGSLCPNFECWRTYGFKRAPSLPSLWCCFCFRLLYYYFFVHSLLVLLLHKVLPAINTAPTVRMQFAKCKIPTVLRSQWTHVCVYHMYVCVFVLAYSIAVLKLRDQHSAAARASTPVPFIYIKTFHTHTDSVTQKHIHIYIYVHQLTVTLPDST